MFLNKMNRLADVGIRARTRFLRRYVSGESGPHKETKEADPYEVNVVAQWFGCSPKEWMVLTKEERMFCVFKYTIEHAPDRATWCKAVHSFADQLMDDEFSILRSCFSSPVDLGDSLDQEASGRRIFNATETLLARHGKTVEGLTFAIEGFGNVGSWIARLVNKAGGKVIAVSNENWALKNKEGIAITALLKRMDPKGKYLADFSGVDSMEEVQLLTSECDVLIPGALGRLLNRKIAAYVKAKFVIETADYTSSIHSHEVLSKKGVVILPDIYANSRVVKMGYLEWLKAQGFTWGKA